MWTSCKELFPRLSNNSRQHAQVLRELQLRKWLSSELASVSSEPHKPQVVKFERSSLFRSLCIEGDVNGMESLLDDGCDVDDANESGLTALHFACLENNIEVVKMLLRKGATVNVVDEGLWTPLHLALSCAYYDIARILIENGANLGALTIDNDLPIDLVPTGDDEVEHLPFIRYLDEEMRRRDMDASALRTREEEELLKDVGQLLGENCDVMVIVSRLTDPRSGASPLHVAAAKDYFTVLNELLELGADPDVTDSDNWTPLHAAAHWGVKNACLLLIERGCNTKAVDFEQRTVQMVADAEVASYLKDLIARQAELVEEAKKLSKTEKLGRLHVVRRRARHQSLKRMDTVTPAASSTQIGQTEVDFDFVNSRRSSSADDE